jgi:hypothetical protein
MIVPTLIDFSFSCRLYTSRAASIGPYPRNTAVPRNTLLHLSPSEIRTVGGSRGKVLRITFCLFPVSNVHLSVKGIRISSNRLACGDRHRMNRSPRYHIAIVRYPTEEAVKHLLLYIPPNQLYIASEFCEERMCHGPPAPHHTSRNSCGNKPSRAKTPQSSVILQ